SRTRSRRFTVRRFPLQMILLFIDRTTRRQTSKRQGIRWSTIHFDFRRRRRTQPNSRPHLLYNSIFATGYFTFTIIDTFTKLLPGLTTSMLTLDESHIEFPCRSRRTESSA